MQGYRTIVANVLTFFATLVALPEFLDLIKPEHLIYVVSAQSAINIGLRFLTSTPVGVSRANVPDV